MIPVQLTIEGLYSYQKKQTIDFQKLTGAGLFGIFGSVGSGKSSVLEAITFALYGKTDRLNLSGDNRNYNMMNLKSDELFIEFEFETGRNRDKYRAVVKGKRNSKRFDEVKALDRSAYFMAGDKWLPIETAELESAIGLSYDNFKRTIIIPQGQFQEFLQLGNKDRTQMMKELFHLENFDLFYKVVSLESKNNESLYKIQGQLQQLGETDPEQIEKFQDELNALNKDLSVLQDSIKKMETGEAEFRKTRELSEKLAAVKQIIATFAEKEKFFFELEKITSEYEKCVLQFKPLLDAFNSGSEKIKLKKEQIRSESEKLALEKQQAVQVKAELKKIQPEFDNRISSKKKLEEFDKIIAIGNLKIKEKNEESRLEKGIQILDETIKKQDDFRLKISQLRQEIQDQKGKLPDVGFLAKAKAWHVEKNGFLKQETELQAERVKNEEELKSVWQLFQKILMNAKLEHAGTKTDFELALQEVELKIQELKGKIKTVESEIMHLQVEVQLETFAGELSDGKECPLCGSVHHPKIYSAQGVEEKVRILENNKKAFEKELVNWEENRSEINFLKQNYLFLQKHKAEILARQEEINNRLIEHQNRFEWSAFPDLDSVELALENAMLEGRKVAELEKLLLETTGFYEKETKNKERFQAELDKIKGEIAVFRTEAKLLASQVEIVKTDDFLTLEETEIRAEKIKLELQILNVEMRYEEFTKHLAELEKSTGTSAGILKVWNHELELEEETLAGLKSKLEKELLITDYNNIGEIAEILNQPVELEKNKQQIAAYRQNVANAKSRFSELSTELGDKKYNSKEHTVLIENLEADKQLLNLKNQEKGEKEGLIKKLLRDAEQLKTLGRELARLELRQENLKTMKSLFKASGFVNYISSVYLQNLCKTANDRFFRLTGQKLSLEITTDNNFVVRDFLNGGKLRNVKTLSGGQTFQAALSLALALADNIQIITESNQNFFFLDEGFGSLDRESLAVVFTTLKSLQKENRIVGVISHVEEMQQEIDVHLRIENTEDSGSKIYKSWVL